MRVVYLSDIKRYIDTLKNPETFYDDIRAYLGDKDYSDHTIKQAQVYADKKYTELGGK